MKKNSVRNLLLSAALILGFSLAQWPMLAHGNNSGNGSLSGGGIPSASDDGSQSNNPIPPVVNYDQSDLNIINGYYLDLIDANLLALSRPGLSAEEVEILTNEIAEAQFILAFVTQLQNQIQLDQEDAFCHYIRQQVEEISARICSLKKDYENTKCNKWWGLPSICDMYCLPEKNAVDAAATAKAAAQHDLIACLELNPEGSDVACATFVNALANAIAAEKAAIAALQECLNSCAKRLGYMPHPKCKEIADNIQKAKDELKALCSPFELGPDGQPTNNPNSNATCPACKEVTNTGYEPIKCKAP